MDDILSDFFKENEPVNNVSGFVPGQRMVRNVAGINIAFLYVPPGSFLRDKGDRANPPQINNPPDISIITKGYWLAETETTQELFFAVMGVNPSTFNGSAGQEPESGEIQNQRPVEAVNWYRTIAFCNKLSLLDGRQPAYSVSGVNWQTLAWAEIPPTGTVVNPTWDAASIVPGADGYRLPTEMEWMWAAMGADTNNPGQPNMTGYLKAFAGSNGTNDSSDYAWNNNISNPSRKTHQAGLKLPNELGLYDMSWNVVEWCWDGVNAGIAPYPGGTLYDYEGASPTRRVVRGGYMGGSDVDDMRLTNRSSGNPPECAGWLGFRLALR